MKTGTVNVLFSLLFTQCSSGASIWEEGERASLSAYLTLYPSFLSLPNVRGLYKARKYVAR